MRLTKREQGIALVATMFTVLIVTMLASLILARTLNEVRTSRDDTTITQTLLLSRAGGNIGSVLLQEIVKPELNKLVKLRSSSTSRWAFDKFNTTGTTPDPRTTATNLAVVASELQTAIHTPICTDSQNLMNTPAGQVNVRIYFTQTACGTALPNGVTLPAARFSNGEPRNATGLGLQDYAMPFVIVAEGKQKEFKRNVVIQGEAIVQIGRSSFARFGYFSNIERNDDGSAIYFTDETLIDGPVHTNQTFALAYDPWFGGEVTSAGCTTPDTNGGSCAGTIDGGAIFYGQRVCTRYNVLGQCSSYSGSATSFVKDENMRPNLENPSYGNTTPIFGNGVAWDAAYIPMPQTSTVQKQAALGKDVDGNNLGTIGLTLSGPLETLELRTVTPTGTAPVKGTNGKWTTAGYQIIKSCSSTACTIYRSSPTGQLAKCTPAAAPLNSNPGTTLPVPSGSLLTEAQCFGSKWNTTSGATATATNPWVTESSKPFNGVIYVSGQDTNGASVKRYKGPARTLATDPSTAAPAVAAFSQLTVAAEYNIRVTGDLKYERSPYSGSPTRNADRSVTSAPADDIDGNTTILGTYSAYGSIRVGSGNISTDLNAPDNVSVQSIIMAGRGKVEVENYNSGVNRGKFNLLGGLIQNKRGAFGTFSGAGGSGTGYDRVYTYDKRMLTGLTPPYFPTTGNDEVKFVKTVTFGQREQVY